MILNNKYYLILDTSDELLTIGLSDGEKLIYSICEYCQKQHSKVLVSTIKKILFLNNIVFDDLKGIIITSGPGSFVGVRISLTVAKIFSFVLNIPIFTISTLRANSIVGCKNIVLLDAKNNRTYIGVFDENGYMLENKIINNEEVEIYINKYNFFKIVCKTDYLQLEKKNNDITIIRDNFLRNVHYFLKNNEMIVL